MATRSIEKLTKQALYLAKDSKVLVPWAAPGAVLAGWMVWPGLTDAYKEEMFGIKAAPLAPVARAQGSNTFRSGGKYKYVRNEIGERPTIEED